ncbi:vesicle transport protein USE1-like [Gigantopelta aegis]|uniref:vesicle transport protein USE1-like n=1 Tax=Gigantopelta aegis TaxID=1735272 RepID=UPI001B889182|nr:vesicle transport protein USE1-like [Gigantopelta aegis]
MAASRQEINFNRLLNRCESMASDKRLKDWRLEKYIGALQLQLNQLKKSSSKPCEEVLTGYAKKVDLLKGLIEAEKLPTATEKSLATERLPPVSTNDNPTQQLHMQTKVLYQQEMRNELLGFTPDDSGDFGVRHRQKAKDEDIDTVLQHHHQMQEKLADEMLALARGLKQNVADAGRIVKDDVKKISDSTRLADTNTGKLKVESERLEAHTKTCSWWIWIMLLVVVATFIWMILFMKLFPKKS